MPLSQDQQIELVAKQGIILAQIKDLLAKEGYNDFHIIAMHKSKQVRFALPQGDPVQIAQLFLDLLSTDEQNLKFFKEVVDAVSKQKGK